MMKSILSLMWAAALITALSVVTYAAVPSVQIISTASAPYIDTGVTLAVVSLTALSAVTLSKSKGN